MILKPVLEKLFKVREDASRRHSRPGADDGYDPHEKPFLEHLEDLRITLMKMVGTLVIATILTFIFNKQIFEFVQLPAKLAKFDDGTSLWEMINFLTLSPQEILMLSIKTAFFAALIVSFPILIYFLAQFILPGLKQAEKQMIIPGALVGFVLFLVGASFAFFGASPLALRFFYEFQIDRVGILDPSEEALNKSAADLEIKDIEFGLPAAEESEETEEGEPEEEPAPTAVESAGTTPAAPATAAAPAGASELDPETKAAVRQYMLSLLAVEKGSGLMLRYDETRDKIILLKFKSQSVSYRIGDYINFITRLTLVFGLSFQLPVVVTILVRLELLTARVMRSTRSFAWIIILISSAILTPPDVFTLALLGGPMILLYEICIWIAWMIESKRAKARMTDEEKRASRLEQLYSKPSADLSEDERKELHAHEIEQYEKEHAHLYEDESAHVSEHDPYHVPDRDTNYDESWHEDHPDWEDHDSHYHGEGDGVDTGKPPLEEGEAETDKDEEPLGEAESSHVEGTVQYDPAAAEREDVEKEDEKEAEAEGEAEGTEPEMETEDERQDKDKDKGGEPPATGEAEAGTEATTEEPSAEPQDEPKKTGGDEFDYCQAEGPIINPNEATFDDLMTLPGMTEDMARNVIDHRPYANFDDMLIVPELTDEVLNGMIDRLALE